MNAMEQRTNSRLRLFAGLLSSAIAACGGAGQDGLVTVGIRPIDGVAASGGTAAGGAGGLPMPGSDVITQILDGDSTATQGDAAGASGASGTFANAGSGANAATAGAGSAGIGAAGAGGSSGQNEDECGAIPSQPAGKVTSGRLSGSGLIGYELKAPNVFTRLRTTLAVPAEPVANGQIFIWPGIQPTPTSTNLQAIGNGAFMSVLTWGPSPCAAGAPSGFSTWWIAPTYSNLGASDPQYSGCHSGKVTLAEPRQFLDVEIRADGTKWIQKLVNRDTMEASQFSMDLKGQAQGRTFFAIELPTGNKPSEDIIFTNTVLSMDMPDPDACQPFMRGTNDFASKPRVSADGKHCCIDRIVLRAPRVMATTTDPL